MRIRATDFAIVVAYLVGLALLALRLRRQGSLLASFPAEFYTPRESVGSRSGRQAQAEAR